MTGSIAKSIRSCLLRHSHQDLLTPKAVMFSRGCKYWNTCFQFRVFVVAVWSGTRFIVRLSFQVVGKLVSSKGDSRLSHSSSSAFVRHAHATRLKSHAIRATLQPTARLTLAQRSSVSARRLSLPTHARMHPAPAPPRHRLGTPYPPPPSAGCPGGTLRCAGCPCPWPCTRAAPGEAAT